MSKRRKGPVRGQMVGDPTYTKYLRSTQWKAKRARLVASRGARCEVCGDTGRLSLHHLNYVRLYDELDSDLLLTCESCHAAFHGRWSVVRAIGAKRAESAARFRIEAWRSRQPSSTGTTTTVVHATVEANEWNGYDPFADASDPHPAYLSRQRGRTPTPSLKDRF